MLEYDPGQFKNNYETPEGKAIWYFLNEHDNLIRMETATYLHRPAAEAVEVQLVQRFGNQVREDRIKQMIGHMIRQIMEAHGYAFDQPSVRITNNVLFSSAARYRAK